MTLVDYRLNYISFFPSRLALVLYDDQRFSSAETALTRRGGTVSGKTLPVGKAGLLLLSKAQVRYHAVVRVIFSPWVKPMVGFLCHK